MAAPCKLTYQILAFGVDRRATRHIVVHRQSRKIPIALSVYETHLAQKSDSPATREKALRHLAMLYTWADTRGLNLDSIFLSGRSLGARQIAAFASWIKQSAGHAGIGALPLNLRRSLNAVLTACSQAEAFFVRQFCRVPTDAVGHTLHIMEVLNHQKSSWKDEKAKDRARSVAPDLTDEEIQCIETYLDPQRAGDSSSMVVRDYLLWRMSIELGLRIGESLAMRLRDCPSRDQNYFQVVRVEERENQEDCRHPYAPRPKTLTRDLGFILKETRFPRLVNDYIAQHRFEWASGPRGRFRRFLLSHPFLLISRAGDPLSTKGAADIATRISRDTGIDFHWHLARHAFFNRAYAGVLGVEGEDQHQARLQDLILWGGWQSEKSLDIYTRRARRERSRNVLMIWQTGGSEWAALS
ncbi:hypothetical protein [Lysobacter sp. GCM10012299]|uniref:hypothetical protein n=1 Tax=Lysobacter sp. GCM10012299 TaxID=3317333 RepID=UPI00361947D3